MDTAAAAQVAGRRLIAEAPVEDAGWATRWVMAPAARIFARAAGDLGTEAQWVTLAGFGFCGLAIVCSLAGWIVGSLVFLLFGLLGDLAGAIGARAGVGPSRWEKLRFPVCATAAVVVVLAMGTTLTLRSAQWGCLVLAIVIVGATWLAAPLARDDPKLAVWRSDPAGLALIGLFGFAVSAPIAALAMSAAHAALSLGWAIRKALQGLARP